MGRLLNFLFKMKRKEFQKITESRDKNFEFPGGVIYIQNIGYDNSYQERKLDVYRPDDTSRKYPVIINVHGGGLIAGNKESNTYFCAQIAKLGFVVFSVEYRLVPSTKIYGQLDDVSRAMDYVCKIAPAFDGDMSNVYMIGDGAGALLIVYALALQKSRRLTSITNIKPSKLKVNAIALISGMFYTARFDGIGLLLANAIWGKGFRNRCIRRFTNPGYVGVVKHLPPCYLISGVGDNLIVHTMNFADALYDAKVKHQLRMFPDREFLGRAFPVCHPYLPESQSVMRRIAKFFYEYRKGDASA